jgi:hypothetical protein
VAPHDVCLVPEKRQEVTTEGGLDVLGQMKTIESAVKLLHGQGIRVSLFIDPEPKVLEAAKSLGVKVVELHTGRYADAAPHETPHELERITQAAHYGNSLGLRINAGHGLHEANVLPIASIQTIAELNIGHAIVAQAIFKGWKIAIADMKSLIQTPIGSPSNFSFLELRSILKSSASILPFLFLSIFDCLPTNFSSISFLTFFSNSNSDLLLISSVNTLLIIVSISFFFITFLLSLQF